MFTLAVLGSSLYGGDDGGQRLRHRRDHRPRAAARRSRRAPRPPGRSRSPRWRSSASPSSRSSASSAGGSSPGIMSYRLQADYRRRVTRQYLRLPLSWHQRHPTGQLLSNANSDVEAAWFFVAPLPVRARRAGHDRDHRRSRSFLTDPLIALVGLVVFPLVFVVNVVYSQVMSPRMQRAQQLRAEVSEIAHESFDAALVVKTLGRETAETERFAGARRGAARRAGRRRPGARSVRPADGGAAQPRHPRRPADRRRAGRRRRHRRRRAWSRSPTCSPCWPCPSARSAGCWPTCPARWPGSTG